MIAAHNAHMQNSTGEWYHTEPPPPHYKEHEYLLPYLLKKPTSPAPTWRNKKSHQTPNSRVAPPNAPSATGLSDPLCSRPFRSFSGSKILPIVRAGHGYRLVIHILCCFPRVDFLSQKQAGSYSVQHSTTSDPHHVLLVYKASKYTANLEGVLNNTEGPTEVISWRWGWSPVKFVYNVWVFKEGTLDLHSDGGYVLLSLSISGGLNRSY